MIATGSSRGGFGFLTCGAGDAPLVLLLHGFPDIPRGFEGLMRRLGRRTVAPWMRGYAPSPLEGPLHADQLAADVVALADELSPDQPIDLVGHDWGAVTTYAAAARHPHRIRRAVTLSVPHPVSFLRHGALQLGKSWYMAFFHLGRFADARASAHDFALLDRLWREWSPALGSCPYAGELKACLRASWPRPLDYYRAMFWPPRAAMARIRDLQKPISVPTLNLLGADDGSIDPRTARGQAKYFADLTEEVLPGVGHFMHLEQPDTIAQRIAAFLR